ncbi:MAG: ribonuclease III [Alphaproteobacteria bacterium]|nr:ribonuclease III [Alphaproteobacteria bacterium]
MSGIEQKIGYKFRQRGLLEEALTHPSCAKSYSNQRLEFLGDTVLGMMVAQLIFRLFPSEREGDLARRQAGLVCGESLVSYARSKNLAEFLILADGEETAGGRDNPTNLEDLVEALFGAIYLDGGLEAVEATFLPYWEQQANNVTEPPKDPKTALQEWAQARGKTLPSYTLIAADGPAHAPMFTIEVAIEDGTLFSATAGTKRLAEREAARLLLDHLEKTQ